MAAPLLAIEHLRVDFPEVIAVRDLTLTVESGDICGLIGPHGAGKTTTLRAVAGLQECTRGLVKIAGQELQRESVERKRLVGFMPAFSPVYDHLTATEFLDHFARAYALPNRARRIEDCLEQAWLADHRGMFCGELSRAMKQRLALAKLLLPDPQVLLLDEPVTGLDSLGRLELWKLLVQLHDAGKATLLSSHIFSELSNFCNKAALLDRGTLLAFGPIQELGDHLNHRRMLVKWRLEEPKALQLLKNSRGVRNLAETGQGARFDFDGEAEALHELLRLLITHDVHVTEWRGAEEDPEQTVRQPWAEVST
jgi:ABC-2 type transport system ATP-binding protein